MTQSRIKTTQTLIESRITVVWDDISRMSLEEVAAYVYSVAREQHTCEASDAPCRACIAADAYNEVGETLAQVMRRIRKLKEDALSQDK